jgi:hypothetical protein
MNVLISCEYSGVSRRAFEALGHKVVSADFEPADDGAPNHYQGDVYEEMMLLPKNQRERLHYLPPSPGRWKLRSRTFEGIAAAWAQQWGSL